MEIIDMATWPRKSQYDLFRQMAAPHFSMTATVDVTRLENHRQAAGISLFNAILYCIMTAANAVPELRMRFRGDGVVKHPVVHASATIPIQGNRFAFCGIEYVPTWELFNTACQNALAKAKQQNKVQEHIDDTDEWIFLSCLPWMTFTALTNPNEGPDDCIPRITWGKRENREAQATIPVSIQVHHALVDGVHVGHFYEALSDHLASWD
jgi:chloramphenicol O-acetyltransferase type A